MLKVINVEHVNTLPGGIGMPYDRAIVIDTEHTEKHIITGQAQPLTVYRGTLEGAHAFVAADAAARCATCGGYLGDYGCVTVGCGGVE